jgi:hypothetical protein
MPPGQDPPTEDAPPPLSTLGYAAGFGLALMALAGTTLHFAYPDTSDVLHFGGSFVAGAAIGAAWARLRGVSLEE